MTDDFENFIERVNPKWITAQEARRRIRELRAVAARPFYPTLETDTVIYKDAEGNYYREQRGRRA